MQLENKTLVLDLVQWVAKGPRPYSEVMEAWRTSCPRFPVWETAVSFGLLVREFRNGQGAVVLVTPAGRALLREHGRA
jgi:hypothetical protein